jgi:glycosyltransferase involved in cell wall biosynthesis
MLSLKPNAPLRRAFKKVWTSSAETYLRILTSYDRLAIGGRSGPRDFRRVCVVAAMQRQNGISIGAQLQVEALRRAGIQAELLDATPALRNPLFRIPHEPASAYIFHSGGPQLASMIASVLPHAATAWRIAYWAWELPGPPRDWPEPEGLVSEIWTPSAFARESLIQRFTVPVSVAPHVVLPAAIPRRRDESRPFTVLTLADSRSSLTRKNVAAAIRSFVSAFGESDDTKLIVKLNGKIEDQETLFNNINNYINIEIIEHYMSDDEQTFLYRSADVLISLHRAEGFGLPMLQAMAQGVTVVATGWSGNMEFTNDYNSILVPARMVPVVDDAVYILYKDYVWAEPDEQAAANALKLLKTNRWRLDELSERAMNFVGELSRNWRTPSYNQTSVR